MKNTKKKKALLLTLLSSMAMAASAVAIVFSSGERFAGISATTQVPGSIVFSRETGEFTKIDGTTSSTSGRTSNGAVYYAVAHSNADVESTGYIAQFGSGDTELQYISFSTSASGGADFEFQKVTGIKVKTSAASPQTMYVQYSSDGSSWSNAYSFYASSSPEKYTLENPQRYIRVKGNSTFARNVVSIEVFYECASSDPEPEEKTISSIEMYWFGEHNKQHYTVGESFDPVPIKVNYSDSTSEVISDSSVSYSGYNMSVVGTYDVVVEYEGNQTSYKIFVEPVVAQYSVSYTLCDVSDYSFVEEEDFGYYLDMENSSFPGSLEAGATCSFTVVFAFPEYFSILGSDAGDDYETVEVTDEGSGTFSFTMPSKNISIFIYFLYIGE